MTMKETEFIIKTLKEWCNQFEGIHIRYAYDSNTEYHIVEVDPESIRRGNSSYKQAELALWTDFMREFPDSDLLICEPSTSNEMTNCLFENPLRKPLDGEIFVVKTRPMKEVTILSKWSTWSSSNRNEYTTENEYSLAA